MCDCMIFVRCVMFVFWCEVVNVKCKCDVFIGIVGGLIVVMRKFLVLSNCEVLRVVFVFLMMSGMIGDLGFGKFNWLVKKVVWWMGCV